MSISSRSLIHSNFFLHLCLFLAISPWLSAPSPCLRLSSLKVKYFSLSLSFLLFRHKLTLLLLLAWIVLIIYRVHLALKSQGSHLPSSMECGLPLRIVLFGAYVAIGMWLVFCSIHSLTLLHSSIPIRDT